MRQRTIFLDSFTARGVLLLMALYLGNEITLCCGAGTSVAVPRAFLQNMKDIVDNFCFRFDCELANDDDFCQRKWCPQTNNREDELCLKSNEDPGCENDQFFYCTYYGASVCLYSAISADGCMYYTTRLGVIVSFCTCRGSPIPDLGSSCTEEGVISATTQSTSVASTLHETSPPDPPGQVNVPAIILGGLLLSVLFIGLGVTLWLFSTYKLVHRRNRNTETTSATMNEKGGERPLELQTGRGRSNNTHHSQVAAKPNKSASLETNHYYSQIRDIRTRDQGRNDHAHSVSPSTAPPEMAVSTQAGEGHHYFVLEQDGQASTDLTISATSNTDMGFRKSPKDHEYFVLERGESKMSDAHAENIVPVYDHIHRSIPTSEIN